MLKKLIDAICQIFNNFLIKYNNEINITNKKDIIIL